MSRREYTPEETIKRGESASRILNDDTYKSAVEEADAFFVQEWRNAVDPTKREAAWAKLHALHEVQRILRTIMDNGKVATARVNRGSR